MNACYFKAVRLKLKMSQKAVASKIGITRQTLSKYELQGTDIPVTIFLKLNILYNIESINE